MDVKIHVFDPSGNAAQISQIVREAVKDFLENPEVAVHELNNTLAPEMTIPYYEAKIAERNGICQDFVKDILGSLWAIQPGCTLSILLRAIAMEMDLNYSDHISQVEDVYVVSLVDGQIQKVKNPGKGYRNIAFFRCLDDAKGACMILEPLFKSLYGGKQENKRSNQN